MNSMIISQDGAIIIVDGKTYAVSSDFSRYVEITNAARQGNWSVIPSMIDVVSTINNAIIKTGNPDMRIDGNTLIYKHVTFPDDLGQYVINTVNDGYDLTPIVKFMDKLLANPDHRVFQQLFGFLAYGKCPITPDGDILAYKKVRDDYTSVYDGVTRNDIGSEVFLDRAKCNSNPEETCSSGLHFCSREYLANFSGQKVVVLSVSPTDVVSIPVDYNNTKGRACRYTVVGELSDVEINEVSKSDVLRVATVEPKYQPKVEEPQPVLVALDGTISFYDNVLLYNSGYRDGKNKKGKKSNNPSYLEGHSDGRNKKPNRYQSAEEDVKPELAKQVNDQHLKSIKENYLAGYKAGANKKKKTSQNSSYLEGYSDGRNKRPNKYLG